MKKFNPNRDYVDSAMKEYLKNGGKIKKIDAEENQYNNINPYLTRRSKGIL